LGGGGGTTRRVLDFLLGYQGSPRKGGRHVLKSVCTKNTRNNKKGNKDANRGLFVSGLAEKATWKVGGLGEETWFREIIAEKKADRYKVNEEGRRKSDARVLCRKKTGKKTCHGHSRRRGGTGGKSKD